MTVVLDTSAVLAVLFDEPGAEIVLGRMTGARMSAVNLAEAMTKLVDKGGAYQTSGMDLLAAFGSEVDAFDAAQAIVAGELRRATRAAGLSLGDRACLALALALDAPVLTADRAWADLDLGVAIEVIR